MATSKRCVLSLIFILKLRIDSDYLFSVHFPRKYCGWFLSSDLCCQRFSLFCSEKKGQLILSLPRAAEIKVSRKQTTAEKLSFEQSHFGTSSTDSEVRTT